jgi:hypothetical protein
MPVDFFDLQFLSTGSALQQKGFAAIQNLRVMEILNAFDPVLAGTLPLDLFVPGSDLDILCHATDLPAFENEVSANFRVNQDFEIYSRIITSIPSVIATFRFHEFQFEIFGQSVPTREQAAYRHMMNEYAILDKMGEPFRNEILQLKKRGIKTEPAFAQLLQLPGDPYKAILDYSC